MRLLQVRPLGCRGTMVAFDLHQGARPRLAVPVAPDGRPSMPPPDVRELFTLWDPQGRPHPPYPEIVVEQAMTGRDPAAPSTGSVARPRGHEPPLVWRRPAVRHAQAGGARARAAALFCNAFQRAWPLDPGPSRGALLVLYPLSGAGGNALSRPASRR